MANEDAAMLKTTVTVPTPNSVGMDKEGRIYMAWKDTPENREMARRVVGVMLNVDAEAPANGA